MTFSETKTRSVSRSRWTFMEMTCLRRCLEGCWVFWCLSSFSCTLYSSSSTWSTERSGASRNKLFSKPLKNLLLSIPSRNSQTLLWVCSSIKRNKHSLKLNLPNTKRREQKRRVETANLPLQLVMKEKMILVLEAKVRIKVNHKRRKKRTYRLEMKFKVTI